VNPETPWYAGRFRSSRGAQQLLFGQMNEDAEIEHKAFQNKGRVFCIASAGCTAIKLCGDHEVVACDINPVQLAYAQRRVRGDDMVAGYAERGMAIARRFKALVGWNTRVVRAFLSLSDVTEQLEFWRSHLDTRRFRASFAALLSRPFLSLVYAPEFLAFLPPNLGTVLRRRLAEGFGRHANATNPYARALLLGEPHDEPRPATCRVQFALGDAASYLESCPAGFFDAFTLSNILDGAQASYRDRLSTAVRHAATKDAVVVLRSFGEPQAELITNYAQSDRALLWGVVDVRSAHLF
jgi:hypothetical protein